MNTLRTIYSGMEMDIQVPEENLIGIVKDHNLPPLVNIEQSLRQTLDTPTGQKKLVELAKPGYKVALITSEYMRMPYTCILSPVVVNMLVKSGIKEQDITLVNAPGTHQTEEEQVKKHLSKSLAHYMASIDG